MAIIRPLVASGQITSEIISKKQWWCSAQQFKSTDLQGFWSLARST